MTSRRGQERGQASVEHIGLITLLALLLVGLSFVTPVAGYAGDVAAAIGGAFAAQADGAEPDPSPPQTPWAEDRATVDRLIAGDLDEFLAYRRSAERDPGLDYSTDLCSAPLVGSSGASFDFTEPCLRHDFGYRNYDALGLFEESKDAVDGRFLADMRASCSARPPADHTRCYAWARVFYEAVHRLGHLTGHGD